MFRLQFKYCKKGILRFLSHLEVIKALERGLRRTDLPLVFSQGFSPHLKLSFGPALPVGVGSRAEYAEVLLGERVPIADFISAMNRALPQGLEVQEARYVDSSLPSLQSQLNLATYEAEAEFSLPLELKEKVKRFLREKQILAARKEGRPAENILPHVKYLELLDQKGKTVRFQLGIKDSGRGTVKPEVVVKAFAQFAGSSVEILSVERAALFVCEGERVRELWES
jgi:radical SAM-linked protein